MQPTGDTGVKSPIGIYKRVFCPILGENQFLLLCFTPFFGLLSPYVEGSPPPPQGKYPKCFPLSACSASNTHFIHLNPFVRLSSKDHLHMMRKKVVTLYSFFLGKFEVLICWLWNSYVVQFYVKESVR